MPRKTKGADAARVSQDIKDVAALVRQAKKRSKELLKKSGRDIRAVRHDVSVLKKVGLVSHRIKAGSYIPTRYMLKKIVRNQDVLTGEVLAVPAPKKVRDKYTSKGIFEARGSALIVPREYEKQRTRITRGMVEISRDLKDGEEIRLILPFKPTDMENVANRLLADPSLDGMKEGDELFGFRLYGHNMNTFGFPNVAEFADYILTHYAHLFSGKSGRAGVKHFEMFRFKSKRSQLNESNEAGRIYSPRAKPKKGAPDYDHLRKNRLARQATRKQKNRASETPDTRSARLETQRVRSARNRQRQFDDE